MPVKRWNIIGLMSGSSMDGVDIANCCFEIQQEPKFEILSWYISAAETINYSSSQLKKLKNVTNLNSIQLIEFDRELGLVFGKMVKSFCEKHNIIPDFVASHGHTVFHLPSKGFSLQIGHPANIAAESGFTVIGDFRSTDIALGGQGAPFAPIADLYLFKQFEVFINLGGIVNISFIQEDNPIIAFDICPGNQVLDYLARTKGYEYDAEGGIASKGVKDEKLFKKLEDWPYFDFPVPKSLDNSDIKNSFLPIVNQSKGTIEDKMHTMVSLIAFLIGKAIKTNCLSKNPNILITGGGGHNIFLIKKIKEQQVDANVVVPEALLVNFKEALLIALMGLLRIYHINNVLSSVTGSKEDHCAGAIYRGPSKVANEIC